MAAAPVEPLGPICASLRTALRQVPIRPRALDSYLEVPKPLGAPWSAGHGAPRLLALLLELEGDHPNNRALLDSDEPSLQLTVITMTRPCSSPGMQLSGWNNF